MERVTLKDQINGTANFGTHYVWNLKDIPLLANEPHKIESRILNIIDLNEKQHKFKLQIFKLENMYKFNIDFLNNIRETSLNFSVSVQICNKSGPIKADSLFLEVSEMSKNTLPTDLISVVKLKDFHYLHNELHLNFLIVNNLPTPKIHCNKNYEASSTKNQLNTFHLKMRTSHNCQFINDLSNLYENKILCDVKIVTKNNEFSAHKNILAARSVVFEKKFKEDIVGKKSSDANIVIDANDDVVEEMLRYVYTGTIKKLNEHVTDLYDLGKQYALKGLQNECVSYINKNLSTDNAMHFLVFAKTRDIQDLQVRVKELFNQHTDEILSSNASSNIFNALSNLKLSLKK